MFHTQIIVGASQPARAARQAPRQGRAKTPAPGKAPAAAATRSAKSSRGWNTRSFDAARTNRLNEAHWQRAWDRDINLWLLDELRTIRARAVYECRNNPMLAGACRTLADDVVGPDGPILTVQSPDKAFNAAHESAWSEWFAAPTFRPGRSGIDWLKNCVRNLPSTGEILSTIGTDMQADGPVQMRLRPLAARRLEAPYGGYEYPRRILGVERDKYDRPNRYWIVEEEGPYLEYAPYSPDDVIHEFLIEEEGQARGYPWLQPSLQPSADLRDYDDQVQDAARQMADQSGLLYTEHVDAPLWTTPEEMDVERRTWRMAVPGWKPFVYPAVQPAVQYPDYRNERHSELGRPMGMPGFVLRLDSSRHNYSSARLDMQGYQLMIMGLQLWLSGSPDSIGMLSRLAALVRREAGFSIPELKRPDAWIRANVRYEWTWQQRGHVDRKKETDGEKNELEGSIEDGVSALAKRGTTPERHAKAQARYLQALTDHGIPWPAWARGQATGISGDAESRLVELEDRLEESDVRAQVPARSHTRDYSGPQDLTDE